MVPESKPPVIGLPPPLAAGPPPAFGPPPRFPRFVAFLLNLFLGVFLADAIISLLDDSLILFFRVHLLDGLRGIVGFFAFLLSVLIYFLMGLTLLVPKRIFLPLVLFGPVSMLATLPFLIYSPGRIQQFSWLASLGQLILGLAALYWFRSRSARPLAVPAAQIAPRLFSWANLIVFLVVNIFVLPPLVGAYLFLCSSVAVNHFSEGFVALRSGGVSVQVRKYVRNDGKTILLVPMSHVAEPAFYRKLSQSFPTNALILMEGVTDDHNLLTNKITYKRMATSLGLAEQQKEFKPSPAQMVRADVDIDQFGTNTIDFLNTVMIVHSKGLNLETVSRLMQYKPPPDFEAQLFGDLLTKRNRHLLDEINSHLAESDHLIVPWGAAHIPELAREIQKSGFRLDEAHEYQAIRFHLGRNQPNPPPLAP